MSSSIISRDAAANATGVNKEGSAGTVGSGVAGRGVKRAGSAGTVGVGVDGSSGSASGAGASALALFLPFFFFFFFFLASAAAGAGAGAGASGRSSVDAWSSSSEEPTSLWASRTSIAT